MVGVVLVLDQYLGLECFGIVGWLGPHCCYLRNLGGLFYHLLSLFEFLSPFRSSAQKLLGNVTK